MKALVYEFIPDQERVSIPEFAMFVLRISHVPVVQDYYRRNAVQEQRVWQDSLCPEFLLRYTRRAQGILYRNFLVAKTIMENEITPVEDEVMGAYVVCSYAVSISLGKCACP